MSKDQTTSNHPTFITFENYKSVLKIEDIPYTDLERITPKLSSVGDE